MKVDSLLSPEDVAQACRLSRRAVYRAIDRGELPAVRLCSRLRIRPDDLVQWIDERLLDRPQAAPNVPQSLPPGPGGRGSFRAMLRAAEREEGAA